jgi:hypothetical protein
MALKLLILTNKRVNIGLERKPLQRKILLFIFPGDLEGKNKLFENIHIFCSWSPSRSLGSGPGA